MTLDSIISFIKAAEYGNFTRAATELYVTQQTLSYQIATLEEELGVKLFNRGKKLSLTPVGEDCLWEAKAIEEHYHQMLKVADLGRKGLGGVLRIGGLNVLEAPVISNSLSKFAADNPRVKIDVRIDAPENIEHEFSAGKFDVCFLGRNEFSRFKDIEAFQLLQNRIKIMVPIYHPLAEKESVSLEEFKDEPFVFLAREIAAVGVDYQISLCRQCGFSPKIEYWAKSRDELRLMVSLGKGIGFSFTHDRPSPSVKMIDLKEATDYFDVFCIYSSKTKNPATLQFINTLKSFI